MTTIADLTTKNAPTWCPGCGDFTILSTIKSSLVEAGLSRENTLIVSGIGCGSKLPHYVNVYGFEGLHGRTLPVATGAKLANPDLNVIAVSGDGDGYGIGGNHFLHTLRRNINITYIVENNAVYGLTKGQTSPTSSKGFKSNSTPQGAIEEPVNPLALAIVGGATYVARGYAMDINHLKKIIVGALKHRGFSLVDIFQQCPTYNKINTTEWYKQKIYKLEDENHNTADMSAALAKTMELDRLPTGLFYQADKPTYDEEQRSRDDGKALVHEDISNVNISALLSRYR